MITIFLCCILGPSPDVDFVISICLQSNIPSASAKPGTPQQLPAGPAPSTSDLSGSSKLKQQTRDRQTGKRKQRESMCYYSCLFCFSDVLKPSWLCITIFCIGENFIHLSYLVVAD